MQRQNLRVVLAAAGLLSLSLTGCCCHSLCGGYGAGYAPAPACPPTYGAGYGVAPTRVAPPACPSGNCGAYPSGAFYGPAPVAAALPGTITTAAVPLNPVPTY